jgi:hypothetical protein
MSSSFDGGIERVSKDCRNDFGHERRVITASGDGHHEARRLDAMTNVSAPAWKTLLVSAVIEMTAVVLFAVIG